MSVGALALVETRYGPITDIPSAAAWIAHHDGKIDAYWREQWRVNQEIKDMIRGDIAAWRDACSALESKVDILTKRVFYVMGVAGAVGAIATLLVQSAAEVISVP